MNWSTETECALHTWLAPETAYKNHPIDNDRFFLFIANVWHDCQSLWDENVAQKAKTTFENR